MGSETVQVRMQEGLVTLIDTAVDEGMYQSRSEVVRDAIRQKFAPELREEVLLEALRISREMDKGKTISHKKIEEEFL